MRYLLFLSAVAPYALEPGMKRIPDIIMALGDASTNPAASSVLSPIAAVDRATYGSVRACVVADSCGAFYLWQTEPTAKCGAQIPIIHWWCPFFRDEVCARFGPRPK